MQASSSIYRSFVSPNPSILLVLSLFSHNMNFFLILLLSSFFFSSYISYIVRGGVPRQIVFLFPPRVSAFARGKITINHFPKFYPPCGHTHPRHFLAPFSAIKSRFEAGEDVCNDSGCVVQRLRNL